MSCFSRRDIFLKIEPVNAYSPLAPILCARHYGRDCMFGEGHESGRLTHEEILGASVDALVFREYLDPHYTVPNTAKLVEADVNEPPWYRRVPGSVLYARPGERLYIHVLNGDRECHSFHLHGLQYGIDSDGAWPLGVQGRDGRRSDEIKPGQTWTYVFDATKETIGAWAFHTHVRQVMKNVNRGLFGGLVVRDPEAPRADHEVPVFFHLMEGPGNVCQFESPRLLNGDTFEFTFGATVGVCNYYCFVHGITMAGQVVIQAGGPAQQFVDIKDNLFSPASVTIGPGGKVKWTHRGERAHIVFASGGGGSTFAINGRAYAGNTPTVEVEPGQRIRWYAFNLDLGAVWHNFHPHAMRWQLPVPPGGAADVHSLSPAESFVADTWAPPALRLPCALEDLQCAPPANACRVRIKGEYLFHCHVEPHMMSGLVGLVRSRQYIWITPEILGKLPIELPFDDGSNDCGSVDVFRCQPQPKPPRVLGPPAGKDDHQPNPAPGVAPALADPGGQEHGGGGPLMVESAVASSVAEAAEKGWWELLPCESPVRIVHAALLRTGKVLFFSGSGDDELYTAGLGSAVWDYEGGTFHVPVTPVDFFCSGQSFLANGQLLVAGGTKDYAFTAASHAFLFDPIIEDWIRVGDMKAGRWYPTLLSLGDGRILTVAGGPTQGEIFSATTGWSLLSPTVDPPWPTYPGLTLLRNGKVFYSGEKTFGGGPGPGVLDLATNVLTPITLPAAFDLGARDQGGTVLLPPAQAQKVMVIGGGGASSTAIADLSAVAPGFGMTASLHNPRIHLNAVLLPDRTVVVTGGESQSENTSTAALEAEIYHPTTNTFTRAAKAKVPRHYHSVALLLPDGRVITAGSNTQRRDNELRLELYHPPYLFKGPRPFIDNAPAETSYGSALEIATPQAAHIKWAQLIRPMATTHSCDTEQRVVDLPIERRDSCRLHVRVPTNPNLAPPGHYMLFIVDKQGIPSVAKWVHLDRDQKLATIASVKVHPAIGIARLGNSRSEFFVGPESPGDVTPPHGGYKDPQGRIKRQAVQFRLFGYDDKGRLVRELTADDAAISWTVHLANKKAAWRQFDGPNPDAPLRNPKVADRKSLEIDPGPRTLDAPGAVASFDSGTFMGLKVPLGEMRTDGSGRLLVLGGFGESHSPTNTRLHTFANNDGWCDDVSDGPVTATVTLNGFAAPVPVSGAWVVVTPPDFAPPVSPPKTMYDVLLQVAVDKLGLVVPTKPSFTEHIYPVIERALRLGWVSGLSGGNHGELARLIGAGVPAAARAHLLGHLRKPAGGGGGDMPRIFSDRYDKGDALTRLQYQWLEKWAAGDFIDDWAGVPPVPALSPAGLDRAGLEACAGGPFYPGVEVGWFVRDTFKWAEPFRLDGAALQPGDVTKQLAVPWQADFNDCQAEDDYAWWPSQRPDDVFPEAGGPQRSWTGSRVQSHDDMVKRWHELGFVIEKDGRLVEVERKP